MATLFDGIQMPGRNISTDSDNREIYHNRLLIYGFVCILVSIVFTSINNDLSVLMNTSVGRSK